VSFKTAPFAFFFFWNSAWNGAILPKNASFHLKGNGAKMCQFWFSPSICALVSFWSLFLDFFNKVSNCPSDFNIYAIKLMIWPNQLSKIII
jgi:hypothetical protein